MRRKGIWSFVNRSSQEIEALPVGRNLFLIYFNAARLWTSQGDRRGVLLWKKKFRRFNCLIVENILLLMDQTQWHNHGRHWRRGDRIAFLCRIGNTRLHDLIRGTASRRLQNPLPDWKNQLVFFQHCFNLLCPNLLTKKLAIFSNKICTSSRRLL